MLAPTCGCICFSLAYNLCLWSMKSWSNHVISFLLNYVEPLPDSDQIMFSFLANYVVSPPDKGSDVLFRFFYSVTSWADIVLSRYHLDSILRTLTWRVFTNLRVIMHHGCIDSIWECPINYFLSEICRDLCNTVFPSKRKREEKGN